MSLVSCVVSTGDRPEFLQQLLRCFRRQTYAARELIVVDGGKTAFEASKVTDPRIRFLRVPHELPLGERLNRGFAASRGPILQKLDDDDFYHRDFLMRAVRTLARAPRPHGTVVGWDCFHVLLKGEKQLRFSGHGWVAGGTLCFTRRLWQRVPFRGAASVDYNFLHDANPARQRVCAPDLYLYVRHGGNIWNRTGKGKTVDDALRSRRPSSRRLQELVEAEDLAFYRTIMEGG